MTTDIPMRARTKDSGALSSGEPSIKAISRDGPGPEVLGTDTLNGNDVYSAAGEYLGQVEEIMLDTCAGRVAYAVLGFGGFLGLGEKLFAIPWTGMRFDASNRRFILHIDKQRLAEAPAFDKDHWPSMIDRTWARNIHAFYGTKPYWE